MAYVRYFWELVLAILGGAYIAPYLKWPVSDSVIYMLLCIILGELITWKFQSEPKDEGICDCGPFNSWTADGETCGNCQKKLREDN